MLPISVLLPVRIQPGQQILVQQLQRALESVFSQEQLGECEIILLDDASPKPIADYRDLVPALHDPRIRIIRFDQHRGLVFALNSGLALARHPWIARIDADDYWMPGKLRAQFEILAANPDLSLIGTGMHLVDVQGAIQSTHVRPGTWAGILEFTRNVGSPFPHGSILARRASFLAAGGYDHDPSLRHCEDFALWCLWIRFMPVATVEAPLYCYTISGNQVSAAHSNHQRLASGRVHATYLALGPVEQNAHLVPELAREFGLSAVEFGQRAMVAWRMFQTLATSSLYVDRLRRLFPDREVLAVEELPYCHAERFCHVAPRPTAVPPHLRHHVEFMDLEIAES